MHVEYGPPGIGGVKTLQYVSGVDGIGEDAVNLVEIVGLGAAALWGYSKLAKDRELEGPSRIVALVAAAVVIGGRVL